MTPFDLTLAALAETNPPVAAAVRAVGPSRSGDPLPGLLAWLPHHDRLDLARAAILAHQHAGTADWHWAVPAELAQAIHDRDAFDRGAPA